jgi:hypothetical protein
VPSPISFVRGAGPSIALTTVLEQLRSRRLYLGLRCDLRSLGPVPSASMPLEMRPVPTRQFTGFDDEARIVVGSDYVQVLLRKWMCDAGVETLFVASDGAGQAIYAQWLVRPEDQLRVLAENGNAHDVLRPDEVLLEGAYTFSRFRGKGAMADGMAQLLRVARDEGRVAAITYVGAENVASLRGCARVGFELDHVRVSIRSLGRRSSERSGITPAASSAWAAAAGRDAAATPPSAEVEGEPAGGEARAEHETR